MTPPADRPPGVLFLCVHNAGRSQMAAAWMQQLVGERVRVYSAGSEPAVDIHPVAVTAMAEVGIDISQARPRPWTEAMVRDVDLVVTMGCGDVCPVVPGIRYVDWDVADPAGEEIETVRTIRDEIEERVHALLEELAVPALEPRANARP